jgi:hypothetical protein
MLNICIFVLQVLLFVLLTPGILLVLPPKSSKYIVAVTHGVVFSALWILLYKPFCKFCSVMRLEGYEEKQKGMEDEDEENAKLEGLENEEEEE